MVAAQSRAEPRRAVLKQLLRILCNKVKMEHLWRKLLRVLFVWCLLCAVGWEHLWRKLLRVLFVWCLAKAGSGTKAEFVAKVEFVAKAERVQGAAVLR